MAIDTTTLRSRRAMLLGAAGGIAALAAQALGRPAPASADGEPIVVGGEYDSAASVTRITNTTSNRDVFHASSQGSGTGVHGGTRMG